MNSQMPQEEMVRLSDVELVNDGKADLSQQIEKILEQLHRNHIL